jgi:hypothetical protein
MQDAGYRPPKVERQKHDRRYQAVRPNHLWHLDFVQRYIGKVSTFTLILIDDCSRYVVGHGVDDAERADMVVSTFEEATAKHGRPERVMHDKGSAFWSWRGISRFTGLLTEMGIDVVVAEHKEWNGKVEVFNANLHNLVALENRPASARQTGPTLRASVLTKLSRQCSVKCRQSIRFSRLRAGVTDLRAKGPWPARCLKRSGEDMVVGARQHRHANTTSSLRFKLFWWVTFGEHKWVRFGERQGSRRTSHAFWA